MSVPGRRFGHHGCRPRPPVLELNKLVEYGRILRVGGCVGGTPHPAAGRPVPFVQPGVYNVMTRNS